MDSQTRVLIAAIVAVALVVAAILFQPAMEERFAPRIVTAWVAIEVAGEGIAEVGPVEIETGQSFLLHAVVEARDGDDQPVYYTRAKRLRVDGQEVAAERLRIWDRPRIPRIRWFTVEGGPPFVEASSTAELDRLTFRELYRADWPFEWTIAGEIGAAFDDPLASGPGGSRHRFGTLRYHVQVELYDYDDATLPLERIRSWGAADLEREWQRFPAVHQVLPEARPASRVFGMPQLELGEGADAELRARVRGLIDKGLAFSRLELLRDTIRSAGKQVDDLAWVEVDLEGGTRWGNPASRGDLLRTGDRVVVLFEDRGKPGILDPSDLCFDYYHGASVRALDQVFAGEGGLELADLND